MGTEPGSTVTHTDRADAGGAAGGGLSKDKEELRHGVSGDAVRDLHRILIAQGLEVPKAELREGFFGPERGKR